VGRLPTALSLSTVPALHHRSLHRPYSRAQLLLRRPPRAICCLANAAGSDPAHRSRKHARQPGCAFPVLLDRLEPSNDVPVQSLVPADHYRDCLDCLHGVMVLIEQFRRKTRR